MSVLSDLRASLAVEVNAALDVPAYGDWPDRFTAPAALVQIPAGSYLLSGEEFGGFTVHLDVLLLVPRTAKALPDLETLIESACQSLLSDTSDWGLGEAGIDAPTVSSVAGADTSDHLVSVIHLVKQIKI